MLQGHERSITQIKYNREGDLLFSSSKDNRPNVWFSLNGERLGTYNGHQGAVWCLDVDWTSTKFMSGGGDMTMKWENFENLEIFLSFKFLPEFGMWKPAKIKQQSKQDHQSVAATSVSPVIKLPTLPTKLWVIIPNFTLSIHASSDLRPAPKLQSCVCQWTSRRSPPSCGSSMTQSSLDTKTDKLDQLIWEWVEKLLISHQMFSDFTSFL